MPPIQLWPVAAGLGVGAFLALIFYGIVKHFGTERGQGFQTSQLGRQATAIIAVLILLIGGAIAMVGLILYAPKKGPSDPNSQALGSGASPTRIVEEHGDTSKPPDRHGSGNEEDAALDPIPEEKSEKPQGHYEKIAEEPSPAPQPPISKPNPPKIEKPEPKPVPPAPKPLALEERQISTEHDKCSGQLYVKDENGNWIEIPRGVWTTVDVAIDGSQYWYWRCGSSDERSRSGPHVERLKVMHSLSKRDITWKCFELVK